MGAAKTSLTARPRLALITPASAQDNVGNWHTAARWARFLRPHFQVAVQTHWTASGTTAQTAPCAMIALHARKSADAIAAFAQAYPHRPLIVVLTGTDLYRDIHVDATAQRSLALATRLVVLNTLGARALPARFRQKVSVIVQSAPRLKPIDHLAKGPRARFRVISVGHLRDEKDSALVMACARTLVDPRIEILHLGRALDARLGKRALQTQAQCARYRWCSVSRAQARQAMRRADLLLHPSKMEGGAQAIIEAICAGTPVIASAIDGNMGLLGSDYPGLFAVGDLAACQRLIERAAQDRAFYRRLLRACERRAPLFDPQREADAVNRLVRACLKDHAHQVS